MVRYNKQMEQEIVKFLRYRQENPVLAKKSYMTLANIAKFINRSQSYVKAMITKIVEEFQIKLDAPRMVTRKIFRQNRSRPLAKNEFSLEQIEFLISRETLSRCSGQSLAERCADFKKKFPEGTITIYKLRKLYQQHKIRMKFLRFTKLPDHPKQLEILEHAKILGREIRFALDRGFRIVYLDEMMTTKRTLPKMAWTLPKENFQLDLSNIDTSAIASVAAVSREFGLDLVMTFEKSVDRAKFLTFLQALRDKFWADDIHLVMDNLSVHRSRVCTERMDELGFTYSWTPAYSPQYNGIEEVFAAAK